MKSSRMLNASAAALTLAAGLSGLARAADAPPPTAPIATGPKATEVQEVIVNGIPFHETVLPTRLSSDSVYGLKLNVMDTPRNTTLISTTQLETLNIQDPRAFSYLTASSYTGSAFGTPNIPEIRGWYADVFINGMRESFTQNGYGAPLNFDALENVAITKGPASVVDGPGPGVGGEADLLTKRPNLFHMSESFEATIDSVQDRRVNVDVGGPITTGDLGFRLDYSGEDSGSYFYGHYMHKNAVYGALRWKPTDNYQLDFNTEINVEQYTENVGDNRVNQALIDHQQYLQGGPDGTEYYSALIGLGSPIPVASPGSPNPYSPVTPILTETLLGPSVPLNTRVTVDQTPGTSSRALKYNAQLIQRYSVNKDITIENNTFFDFQDSDNQEGYYYADESDGSYTFENRLDVTDSANLKLGWMTISNEAILGVTYRFAHTSYISDFNDETLSVYDLTGNPKQWTFDPGYQLAWGDAYTYKSVFGRTQFGVPGRDATNAGNTGISDLNDTAIFFQDRAELSPQWSVLFGARIDAVQNHTHDPLGGAICGGCFNNLPQDHSTGVYGLGNANLSVVYKPMTWLSTYATFNFTQSNFNNGGEGGVNTYGVVDGVGVPDSVLLRQSSFLYEAGVKANLLKDKLFVGAAVFDQKRPLPTGFAGTVIDNANIEGAEIEMNYQPTRNLFATASYSFIRTTLENPYLLYNYPASPGVNVDGSALFAVYKPGQTFYLPGFPEHIFNFLGNYKFDNGLGLRTGVQVTGPINISNSGYLDEDASTLGGLFPLPANIVAAGGYNKSPVIPWQYTWNAAVFYEFGKYTATLSVYNLTDRINWESAPSLYANDMLVRENPRTYELRLQAKF